MNDHQILFTEVFNFSENEAGLKVRGVAFRAGRIEAKKVIIPHNELQGIAESLNNKPFFDSHSKTVGAYLGEVTRAWVQKNTVQYSGEIFDKKSIDLIRKGVIKNVSIGLKFKDIAYDDSGFATLSGIEAVELSLCFFPALASTSVETYSFNLDSHLVETPDSSIVTLTYCEYQKLKEYQLNAMILEKKLFVALHCPFLEWDDRFTQFSIDDISDFHALARMKTTPESIGSAGLDDEPLSAKEKEKSLKEDIREMIFRTRRDGKELQGINREYDLDFRLR